MLAQHLFLTLIRYFRLFEAFPFIFVCPNSIYLISACYPSSYSLDQLVMYLVTTKRLLPFGEGMISHCIEIWQYVFLLPTV